MRQRAAQAMDDIRKSAPKTRSISRYISQRPTLNSHPNVRCIRVRGSLTFARVHRASCATPHFGPDTFPRYLPDPSSQDAFGSRCSATPTIALSPSTRAGPGHMLNGEVAMSTSIPLLHSGDIVPMDNVLAVQAPPLPPLKFGRPRIA